MKHIILGFFFCCFILNVSANNISVSGVGILGQNTSAGVNNAANFSLVQFNLRWENSWRVATGPANWDAAWVFVKFRVGASNPTFTGVSSSGTTVTVSSTANLRVGMPVRVTSGTGTGAFAANTVISSITNTTQFVVSATPTPLSGASIECIRIWEHARLNNTGHTAPSGSTIDVGLLTPGSAYDPTTNPALGIFIYRNAVGSGTNTFNNVQIRWNYGANGLNDNAVVSVQVFAVEMVYVPQGSFFVGSGGTDGNSLTQANSTSGNTVPFQITATPPTIQANNTGSNASNLSARLGSPSMDLTGMSTGDLAAGFPTGFNAFYCMKYEISQGQYRDFLNTLTYTQQVQRTATAPTAAAGNGALVSTNANRNGIDIETPGNPTTLVPALYGCNLNGNTVYNETNDGEWIACNFLTWMDGAAYLDWAGLRPMTELEYEKACRGNLTPVPNEYAWGTASIVSATYTLANAGTNAESIATNYSNTVGNANYNSTAPSSPNNGPMRVGIFAAGTTSRVAAGASFYGIMEMSGNLHERAVMIGNVAGRSYTGMHGDGNLLSIGHANVNQWPGINGNTDIAIANGTFSAAGVTGAAGSGFRGGSFISPIGALNMSFRDGSNDTSRNSPYGFRGVRTAQ